VTAVALDGAPASVAVVGDEVWTASAEAAVLWRVSRTDGAVLDTIEYAREGQSPYFAGFEDVRIYPAGDSVFVLGGPNAREVVRLSMETGEVLARLKVPSPLGAASTGHAIWIGSFEPYEVLRLDLGTGEVVSRIPSEGPTGLGVAFGRVWVLDHRSRTVTAIDPGTDDVAGRVAVRAPYPERLGVGEGGVWVSSPSSDRVLRIDPARMEVVAKIPVAGDPQDFAAAGGRVWVGTQTGLAGIDPGVNEVTATVELGPIWGVMASDEGGLLWAASPDVGMLYGIDPSRV
jgi:outer membrane protein assembly factor BamB